MERRVRRREKLKHQAVDVINSEMKTFYPIDDNENVIPSQKPLLEPAYTHEYFQADIEASEETTPRIADLKNYAPVAAPFVITTFDARPVNANDFIKTPTRAEIAALAGQTNVNLTYVVPDGRVLIARKISNRIYLNALGGTPVRSAATAQPNAKINLNILVDGLVIDQLVDLALDDASVSGVTAFIEPMLEHSFYFLANAGQTITFNYEILNPLAFTFAYINMIASGNLLLRQGVNPASEPATLAPVPTRHIAYNTAR